MLQQLRNPYWMKWGMWVVLGLTIPSFVAFYGFSNVNHSGQVAVGTLVTVKHNGETHELGRDEMLAARSDAANYFTQIAAAIVRDPNQMMGLQREIYEAMGSAPRVYAPFAVADVALSDRTHEMGIRVTDAQVSEFLRNQGVTAANFAERYGNASQYEVAASIRQQLQAESADRTVNSLARTSLWEVLQEYSLREEKLTISYARIPIQADPNLAITEAEIQAKYDELAKAESPIVLEPQKRVFEYVALRLPPRTLPMPTEEQIVAAYEAAPATDTELAQETGYVVRQIISRDPNQAEAALALIRAGADFGTTANNFSIDLRNLEFTDPETSPTMRGGLVAYTLQGNEVDAWGAPYMAFLSAAKVGDISDVLPTPQGFAIVKLEEKRGDTKKPLEQVRSIITARVRQQLQEQVTKDREGMTRENLATMRKARRSETTLAGIARVVNSTVETTSPTLTSSLFFPGMGNMSANGEAINRLRPERMSEPMSNSAGDVIVLRIKEVIPPTNRPLDTIRTRIEQQVRTDKAAADALAKAEAMKTRLQTNTDDRLTSVAAELSYEFATLEPSARQDVPPALATAPEAQTLLIASQKNDLFVLRGGTPELPTEYLVVRVEDVAEASKEAFLKEMQELERDLLAAKRKGYLEDFRRDAVASMNVEYNADFMGEENAGKQ